MLVGAGGARPVADDDCSAKETKKELFTMFNALLEGASVLDKKGCPAAELLWVPE